MNGRGPWPPKAAAMSYVIDARHWPSVEWPADVGSDQPVSRKVYLEAGRRYWLGLSCILSTTSDATLHPCQVGVRLHTHNAPARAHYPRRRLAARYVAPPFTTHLPGALYGNSKELKVVEAEGDLLEASNFDYSLPRQREAYGTSEGGYDYPFRRQCVDIIDKTSCCRITDGSGRPCIPAATRFKRIEPPATRGAVCQSSPASLRGRLSERPAATSKAADPASE